MAENTHHASEDVPAGTMDITEHVKMWLTFWSVAKWSALSLLIIAALLAIFRTHNG
jgi:aa3 type cytochrome c oxidase subunit IV